MRLSTLTTGTGPKRTVLVHGLLGSGRSLSGLARAWSARDPSRTFLLPDLAGHGSSGPLPPGVTLRDLARDVRETCGDAPFDLVGHSLGGRVALALLGDSPRTVRTLTLLDIAPGPLGPEVGESATVLDLLAAAPATVPDRESMRRYLGQGGLDARLVEWLLTNLKPSAADYVWRVDAKALREAAPRTNAEDLWPVVEAHDKPIRCIRGGRSPYVGAADVRRLERAGCPVATIDDAGHFLHVDALGRLVELLAGAP